MVAYICRPRSTLLSLLLGTTLFISVDHTAADVNEAGERLSRVKKEIDAIQSRLSASEQERDTLQSTLREIDLQIGASDIKADELNRERRILNARLQSLDQKGQSLRAGHNARVQLIELSVKISQTFL